MKPVSIGVFALTLLASAPVFAGAQYRDLWNPPEARAGNPHVRTAYASATRHRIAAHNYHRHHIHRQIVATATVPRASSVAATRNQSSRLTFDDIPRQITPEGNVLRVNGGHVGAEVER